MQQRTVRPEAESLAGVTRPANYRDLPVAFDQRVAYIYRWNRMDKKDHLCLVRIRARTRNSCQVEFADGLRAVTSRNAIRKVTVDRFHTLWAMQLMHEWMWRKAGLSTPESERQVDLFMDAAVSMARGLGWLFNGNQVAAPERAGEANSAA